MGGTNRKWKKIKPQIVEAVIVVKACREEAEEREAEAQALAGILLGPEAAQEWADSGFPLCLGHGADPRCKSIATEQTAGEDAEWLCAACFADMIKEEGAES